MSGFSGFVWTEGAFVLKKSIQTQKYRDSYGRRLSQTQFLSWNRNYPKLGFSNNQWRIQGGPARPDPPPHDHNFWPNWGPKSRIFFLGGRPPPPSLISGSGGPGLSLIWRFGVDLPSTLRLTLIATHFFISCLLLSCQVVHHAVSLLVSAAFTDGTVRSSLLQQSNFKPWLQQLVLLAKEVTLTLFARRKTCEIVRQSYHAVCCPFFGRLSMRWTSMILIAVNVIQISLEGNVKYILWIMMQCITAYYV